MLDHLRRSGAPFVALSGWLNWCVDTDLLEHTSVEPHCAHPPINGETYVFWHPRRGAAAAAAAAVARSEGGSPGDAGGDLMCGALLRFPPLDKDEDRVVMSSVLPHYINDDRGLFVHVEHARNTCPRAQGEPLALEGVRDADLVARFAKLKPLLLAAGVG